MTDSEHAAKGLELSNTALQATINSVVEKLQEARLSGDSDITGRPACPGCRAD